MSSLLEKLPALTFAEKDTAVIENDVISFFQELLNAKLYDGDPKKILLLGFAKYLALQRNALDFAAKQNLLAYSADGFIQHLGAFVNTHISEAKSAVTTLSFTLSEPLSFNTTVKKGTRATAGDKVYFATADDVEIKAGELTAEADAVCTVQGAIGNGYEIGQINQLSDPFPYNCTVSNTEITQGGADRENIEAYRERIREAPESFASGTKGAYIFFAKSASSLIADVSVRSPSTSVVEIVPLLTGGDIPTQSLLDTVYEQCADDARRGFTDYIIVKAPEIVPYDVKGTYYISRKDSAASANIYNKAQLAVNDFVLWQKSALGRDINPSKLTEMLMQAGVKRVELDFSHKKLEYCQVAVADGINVGFGGLEND